MTKSLDQFKSAHAPDQEVEYLRARVAELERIRHSEREATGEAREIIFALSQAVEKAKPVAMQYKPQKTSSTPITQVLHLTDLHYGEVIAKDEIEGINEFSPEVAVSRLQLLCDKVLDKVKTQRAGYNVPHLHILGTADYISGDIHHELQVTNAFPCPQQAVECGYAIGALVATLASHYSTVTVDMITLDNHGRLTQKNQAAQGGLNNWGYVVAQVVQQHVRNISNVKTNIHARASAIVPIGAERYLLFHGHQIKGWAGLPYYGFDRRVALEAVKRMGFPELHFTKLVCGHFHVSVDSDHWMIGGSLSGTNAFDHASGRHSQAHQTSWFVHPEHGQFDFTRWWLGPNREISYRKDQ